ncbi:class I SAM-dependent methyltransferase [Bradyrhizobium sp. 38]|uniref:class I SAM-dependent methyltransferase n=1 Tax=unclassified Bradyrhizobium TaxID=2631580 RepID=UPI001FFBADF7|nr:class I SAM-dependent methyltransferase [Bradyrhizobium sp. 38]MCK1780943.1 class I SAM-dependent methyltransferase [Bradyrhizobium sp. 132]
MAERITGLYRAIRLPAVYKGLMSALGADNAIRRYVSEVLEPAPGIKMLDVGCGPANVLAYLPALDYTGIDHNENHIAFARQLYGSRGRFIVGSADQLHQDGNSFDLINVSAILHHLDDDQAKAMFKSLKPLLKHGGRITTIDNVWLPRQRAIAKFINNLDSGMNIRTPEGYLGLMSGLGYDIQPRVFHDLLRVPYDHFVMVAQSAQAPSL